MNGLLVRIYHDTYFRFRVRTVTVSYTHLDVYKRQVKYGPVRASDIKKYLAAGYKTDEKMRRVTFPFLERLKLVPVELVYSGKYLLIALAAIFALSVFGKQGIDLTSGFVSMMLLVTGYLAGAAVSPMILPWLPFRSFALKGLIAGILCTWSILVFYFPMPWFLSLAWMLINSGIASFLAMNFTGASTYTSLSGVKKEMKTAIPLQIASVSLGLVLLIVLKFI